MQRKSSAARSKYQHQMPITTKSPTNTHKMHSCVDCLIGCIFASATILNTQKSCVPAQNAHTHTQHHMVASLSLFDLIVFANFTPNYLHFYWSILHAFAVYEHIFSAVVSNIPHTDARACARSHNKCKSKYMEVVLEHQLLSSLLPLRFILVYSSRFVRRIFASHFCWQCLEMCHLLIRYTAHTDTSCSLPAFVHFTSFTWFATFVCRQSGEVLSTCTLVERP